MFPGAGRGPELYDRLPMVIALLASYDPDIKGVANMIALVDALREDLSLWEICGFIDLAPSRPTFIRTLEILEQEGAWQICHCERPICHCERPICYCERPICHCERPICHCERSVAISPT